MLDLHTHSSASDGTLSPADLVKQAEKLNLTAVALTDHDSVGGLDEAISEASVKKVEFIPGIELSAKLNDDSMHFLGLFIDHKNSDLLDCVDRVTKMRNDRNPRLAARLQDLGVPVTIEEASQKAGSDIVGRPHFAQVMVEKGYVTSTNEAFHKYLGNRAAASVRKERLSPSNAIAAIRRAGGVPILAHPDQTRRTGDALDRLVANLRELGLAGIETFYPSYTARQTNEYSKLAEKYDLIRSGGTDFHGAAKPKISLGCGFGSMFVHDDLLEPIRAMSSAIGRSNQAG